MARTLLVTPEPLTPIAEYVVKRFIYPPSPGSCSTSTDDDATIESPPPYDERALLQLIDGAEPVEGGAMELRHPSDVVSALEEQVRSLTIRNNALEERMQGLAIANDCLATVNQDFVARTIDAVAFSLNITIYTAGVSIHDHCWRDIVALAVTIVVHSALPPDFKSFLEHIMLNRVSAAPYYVRWMVVAHLWRLEVLHVDMASRPYNTVQRAFAEIRSMQYVMSKKGMTEPPPCMYWLQMIDCKHGSSCSNTHLGGRTGGGAYNRLDAMHVATLHAFMHALECTGRSAEDVMLCAYTTRREPHTAH